MLNSHLLQKDALKSPLMIKLIEQLEPNVASHEFLELLASQYSAIGALETAGFGRKVVDAFLAVKDPKRRSAIYSHLLSLPVTERLLTDEEAHAAIQSLFAGEDAQEKIVPLLAGSAISRMIKLGYFRQIEVIAESTKTSRRYQSNYWQFLINPAVIQHMRSQNRSAKVLLETIARGDRYRRRYYLQTLLPNESALQWFLSDLSWDDIDKEMNRLPQRERDQVHQTMASSYPVMNYCVSIADLSIITSIRSFDSNPHQRRNLVSHVARDKRFADTVTQRSFAKQIAKLIQVETDENYKKVMLSSIRSNNDAVKNIRADEKNALRELLQ